MILNHDKDSSDEYTHDIIAKRKQEETVYIQNDGESDGTPEVKKIDSKIFSKFSSFSKKLDSLGVENAGIDRIPPYERGSSARLFLHVAGLWLSATGGLSSMSSFLLGPLLFELTFNESLVSGLIGMTIGCFVAAYCSTMGPQSGCRQMVTARYLFGWWFVKFVALAAIVGVMGWSVVNSVVGGEMLAAISDDKVPVWIGIVIVSLCSFLVAVFGIKQVLKVETYLAIPVLTTFLLLYISSSDKYDLINDFSNADVSKSTIKGNWLSFFSLCYSVTATWGSITADYYILFPEDTAQYKVFLLTLFGTLVPTLFVAILGVILAAIATTSQPWNDEYVSHGMGGLLWSGFERWNGFGKFCVVVLILSLISNNIINTYSAAFSIQLSSVFCAKVPRWFWSIVCTIVYLVCALVGRNHFSTILGNFLPMIGYWISMYFILLLEENLIFRKYFLHMYTKEFPLKSNDDAYEKEEQEEEYVQEEHSSMQIGNSTNMDRLKYRIKHKPTNIHLLKRRHIASHHRYNWDEWDNYEVLTNGYAASFAFICGIAGVVVGMAQAYWIGPIARNFGEFGGDIAMWLSMGFSGAVYPLARYYELKKFGR